MPLTHSDSQSYQTTGDREMAMVVVGREEEGVKDHRGQRDGNGRCGKGGGRSKMIMASH